MRIGVFDAVAFLVLAGCATKYQDMGFSGGVAAEQMTADTWRIRARGNAYTNSATVQDFVFLKAAETAQGGTHFQIISGADTSKAASTTTVAGHQAYTTSTPGTVDTVIKPGQDVYVRVLKVLPGQQVPAGAISAGEVIQFTGPHVRRDS